MQPAHNRQALSTRRAVPLPTQHQIAVATMGHGCDGLLRLLAGADTLPSALAEMRVLVDAMLRATARLSDGGDVEHALQVVDDLATHFEVLVTVGESTTSQSSQVVSDLTVAATALRDLVKTL